MDHDDPSYIWDPGFYCASMVKFVRMCMCFEWFISFWKHRNETLHGITQTERQLRD